MTRPSLAVFLGVLLPSLACPIEETASTAVAPSWLQLVGATATYRCRPLVNGSLPSGSLRITVVSANGTHTDLKLEGWGSSGWGAPTTYAGMPSNRSTVFWLAEQAEVGSLVFDHQFSKNPPNANMTTELDDDYGGPRTLQEGVRVTVETLDWMGFFYSLTVLYDASCGLALQYVRKRSAGFILITEEYCLHETNVDLGLPAISPWVSLLFLGIVLVLVVYVIPWVASKGLRRLRGRHEGSEPPVKRLE